MTQPTAYLATPVGQLLAAAKSNPETVLQPLVIGFATAVAVFAVGGDAKSAVAAGVAGLVVLVFVTLPARVAQMTAELREVSRSIGVGWVEVVSALAVTPAEAAGAIEVMLNGGSRVKVAAVQAAGASGAVASLSQRRAAVDLLRRCETAAVHPFCEGDPEKLHDFGRALRDEIRGAAGSEQTILVAAARLTSKTLTAVKPFTPPEVSYD